MTTVQAIQHADVKGKILNYIRIKNGQYEVLINVGEKTYNAVKQIEKVIDIPDPIQEEEKKNKKRG